MITNLTWDKLIEDMKSCEQASGQNMYQHGASVWDWYDRIRHILNTGSDDSKNKPLVNQLKLPEWFFKYEEELARNRLNSSHLHWYTHYHDCGKPYCREIRGEKVHYPDHAEVSYNVWMKITENFPIKYRDEEFVGQVGRLIRRDMDIHTLKAKEVDQFCKDKREAVTLLLVGLAEVHSNAEMFGGRDSTSFKIKWKQIDRRGRAICKKLFGEIESH
jgi:hypothetical protein